MTARIQLGDEVRCRVTGFKGHAVARVEYIEGHVEFAVSPPMKDQQLYPKPQYIPEPRLVKLRDHLSLPPTGERMGFKYPEGR